MLFILTVYLLLVWLLFSKLELLKWGWVSGIFVALGGAFILAVFLALFNYLTPSGSFTVVSRVTEVTPNVSGQVIEIPVKRRIGDPPPLIHTRRVPRARLICLSRIRGIRKRHSAQAMQSSQHRAPRRSELLSDLRSRKTLPFQPPQPLIPLQRPKAPRYPPHLSHAPPSSERSYSRYHFGSRNHQTPTSKPSRRRRLNPTIPPHGGPATSGECSANNTRYAIATRSGD